MKRLSGLIIALCISVHAHSANPLLVTETINAAKVVEGLPLTKHEVAKSANGRKRQRWVIEGVDSGKIEIIGNDQADADQVSMHCLTFDKAGNAIPAVSAKSPCQQLFIKLLAKFTTTPESFAKRIIEDAVKTKLTETRQLGSLSLESDGEFYAVRRLNRLTR